MNNGDAGEPTADCCRGPSSGVDCEGPRISPLEKFRDCIRLILQSGTFLSENDCDAVHNCVLNSLTIGTPFSCVPAAFRFPSKWPWLCVEWGFYQVRLVAFLNRLYYINTYSRFLALPIVMCCAYSSVLRWEPQERVLLTTCLNSALYVSTTNVE